MPRMKVAIPGSAVRKPGAAATPSGGGSSPEAFGASGGRALQQFGREVRGAVDVVYQRVEQGEKSDINAEFAKAQADMTLEWQERLRTADPSDRSLSENFLKDYDSRMEEIGQKATTVGAQSYFRNGSADMRARFQTTAASMQSEMAGRRAAENFKKTVSDLSSSLLNDPSSFTGSVQILEDGINNDFESGMISREIAEELRAKAMPELTKAQIRGWIRLDPKSTGKNLTEGKWDTYIDGDTKQQMFGEVKVAEEAARVQAERARMDAERARQKRESAAMTNYFKELRLDGKFDVQAILDDADLDFASKVQMVNMGDAFNRAGGKIAKDPGTIIELFNRIHAPDNYVQVAPDGTRYKISDEKYFNKFFGKGLDTEALTMLRGELQGKGTVEGERVSKLKHAMTEAAYAAIVKKDAFGLADTEGSKSFLEYLTEFTTTWDQRVSAGVSPNDLTNPTHKEYMGKFFEKYRLTPQQKVRNMAKSAGGAPAPISPFQTTPVPAPSADGKWRAQENETPAEYLKRRKGN